MKPAVHPWAGRFRNPISGTLPPTQGRIGGPGRLLLLRTTAPQRPASRMGGAPEAAAWPH